MAAKKTQRQLADEAYLRSQQLDISGELEPAPGVIEPPVIASIPTTCPSCERPMTLASGWTVLRSVPNALQCGGCAQVIRVLEPGYSQFVAQVAEYAEQRAARLAHLRGLDKKKGIAKRERGAG